MVTISFSGHKDGRTDTMCENNDHLFGRRDLVGQLCEFGNLLFLFFVIL